MKEKLVSEESLLLLKALESMQQTFLVMKDLQTESTNQILALKEDLSILRQRIIFIEKGVFNP